MHTLRTIGDLERLAVAVSENVLFQKLEDEVVLLNLETGDYYGLNEVGSQMWTLLQQDHHVGQVLSALLETYEVSEGTLKADLWTILGDLEAHGLVTLHEDAS